MKTKPDTAETASLEEQYAVLQHLYGTAPVGLCLLDPDLRYVQINERLAAINGVPVEAHLGRRLVDVVPGVADVVVPFYRRVLATGEPILDMEVSAGAPADPAHEKHWLVSYHPFKGPDGRVTGVSTVVQEITERKRVEQQLQENENKLRLLLGSTRAVPWVADAKTWRFTYVGPQAERLLGYPVETWLGESFWIDHLHPGDRDEAVAFCQASTLRHADHDLEYRMIAADGRVVWVQDIVSVVFENGEPAQLRGILFDITERKATEAELMRSRAQLRLVADSVPVLIAYVDADERFRFTNLAYAQWTDRSSDDLDGRTLREVVGEQRYAAVREHVRTALSGRKVDHASMWARADGEPRHVETSYVPHVDARGKVAGFFALVRDVTERVRADEEASRRRDELVRVSRKVTLGELSASLAHELNQPLCAVVSNAQAARRMLAAENPDLSGVGDALNGIILDGKRAADVIARLRELLEKREPAKEPLDVNGVIEGVLRILRRDLAERAVAAKLDFETDLPPVLADRVQLQQIVLNLVLNGAEAMQHLDDGERRLVLRTRAATNGGVVVDVQDHGPGIDPDAQPLVFEPFFTTKAHGLGMGLAISRSIVEAHGGTLVALPSNGSPGATLRFTLPGAGKHDG
jgi:PAS domain S-box-containing protein